MLKTHSRLSLASFLTRVGVAAWVLVSSTTALLACNCTGILRLLLLQLQTALTALAGTALRTLTLNFLAANTLAYFGTVLHLLGVHLARFFMAFLGGLRLASTGRGGGGGAKVPPCQGRTSPQGLTQGSGHDWLAPASVATGLPAGKSVRPWSASGQVGTGSLAQRLVRLAIR